MAMKKVLIVGLGNPGEKYSITRHNAGFMFLDYFAGRHGFVFRLSACQALVAEGNFANSRLVLAQPLTYMNRSGQAVAALVAHYKLTAAQILLVHDDIDLTGGRLKMVASGGSGGHRGVASVIEALATSEFPRIKIGVGRPEDSNAIEEYVLAPLPDDEREAMILDFPHINLGVEIFLEKGLAAGINFINTRHGPT
jgi:PTH1 family peptidyl-tRNA hydrolase